MFPTHGMPKTLNAPGAKLQNLNENTLERTNEGKSDEQGLKSNSAAENQNQRPAPTG